MMAPSRIFATEKSLYSRVIDHFGRRQVLASEVPFEGKRIDLVFVDRNGVTNSVEAKLKDWRGALRQATTNRLACDYSYVAIPRYRASRVDLEMFKRRGVGLIVVDGYAEVAIRARRSEFKDPILARNLRRVARELK